MRRLLFISVFIMAGLSAFAAGGENGFEIFASYDPMAKTVEIRWKNREQLATLFILQKSRDQLQWENIDTLFNAADFNEQQILWEDRNPVPGGFLYRLKTVVDEQNFSVSKPVFVQVNPFRYTWDALSCYQNTLLKIRYTGEEAFNGVINLFITTRSGRVLLRSRFSSLTRYIEVPVANLGKGVYYVSMFVDGEMIWRERYVK